MNKTICMGLIMLIIGLFSSNVSAGFPNNSSCNESSECTSGYCAQGYCCDLGQCGAGGRCWEIGEEHQWSMNNGNICTDQGWKTAYSRSCSSNEACVTGKCINGACCNPNQCAMAYMSPLFCKNVGEEVYYGQNQVKICVSEGVWATKTKNGYACTNDTDCLSNHCADGLCCNISQCGAQGRCWAIGEEHQWSMNNGNICTETGWKTAYSRSCSNNEACVTGKCINGACCNPNQCAMAYMSPLFCKNVGEEVYYGNSQKKICVSEGVWITKTNNGYACTNNSDCYSNYCMNGVCSASSCENLWWFDNTTNFCGYDEFCGEYMYYGLRTFQNLSDCVAELSCVEEGDHKIIVPGAPLCCPGLTPINPRAVDEWGGCSPPAAGASVCTYCGNGLCGLGENKCNCPEDCPSCSMLWWFDNENYDECGLKQFCGEYMYYGLRTFITEEDCLEALGKEAPVDCFTGVSIFAMGRGTFHNPQTMQLWVDGSLKAEWNAFDMSRQYQYPMTLSCGTHNVDVVYSKNPSDTRVLDVYMIRVYCSTMYSDRASVIYDRAINSTPFDGIDVVAGRTDMQWPGALRYSFSRTGCGECMLVGDNEPCGEISVWEVITTIIKWNHGEFTLQDVINLIDAWRQQN